jgi:glycosyltransferase involved in cell wall biosynthesis
MQISVVVPCYNEGALLSQLHARLVAVLEKCAGADFEVIYVDDGSQDDTRDQLYQLSRSDPHVAALRLSRNFGQEAAISAGLVETTGDAVVIIDADLQDSPEVISEMYQLWRDGWQVVIGEREERMGETMFKRWAATAFYRLLGALNPSISHGTGNFRLLDRSVVNSILAMPENTRFVRGMISWVGFRQKTVMYRRAPRVAGKSKYSLAKMLRLAGDAVTSFSFAPLRLSTIAGLTILLFAIVELTISMIARHPLNTILLAILFLGGVQLLSIGIIGEYIGRIFAEVKRRPLFVVQERFGSTTGRKPM